MRNFRPLFLSWFGWTVLALLCSSPLIHADVVKPALIEIKADNRGPLTVEIRASIEALLTGINARYRDTTESPNGEQYDVYRNLESDALREEFSVFQAKFLANLWLEADGERIPLEYTDVAIPEPGYTKVPRISVISLAATISPHTRQLQWFYPARFGDNAVRVQQVDAANEKWHWSSWQWIRDGKASQPFNLDKLFTTKSVSEVALSYIKIGFDHIIPLGLDHILFILGIFLLNHRFRPLLWQVTMFTVAHTITLGLSMYGLITLPARIVEPLIALSIAYVGLENLFTRQLHRSRIALVFAFGLLHGMGFAGALSDFGMPKEDFAVALISFNVGVELGQLAVIALAYIGVAIWFRKHPDLYRKWVVIPSSLMIAVLGLYWAADRLEWI